MQLHHHGNCALWSSAQRRSREIHAATHCFHLLMPPRLPCASRLSSHDGFAGSVDRMLSAWTFLSKEPARTDMMLPRQCQYVPRPSTAGSCSHSTIFCDFLLTLSLICDVYLCAVLTGCSRPGHSCSRRARAHQHDASQAVTICRTALQHPELVFTSPSSVPLLAHIPVICNILCALLTGCSRLGHCAHGKPHRTDKVLLSNQ